MIKTIKVIYRSVIPKSVRQILRPIMHIRRTVIEGYLIKTQPKRHKKALEIVRNKNKIKVAFFLIHDSVWKYEGVYKLMEEDKRFEPIVVVCPFIAYGEETMLLDMNQAYENFKIKGYNVIKTLNEETGEWLDVKKGIRPDIVFFTNPWKLTKDKYYIDEFTGTLTCYVPYFFHVTKHLKENYSGILQNLVWRVYYETKIHESFAKLYSRNNASNVVITGYPGLDSLIEKKKVIKDPWKIQSLLIKRIIWAPHHTIEGQDAGLKYSNFSKYAQFIFEFVRTHPSEIQIAFKPHPLLKSKLYKDRAWGHKRTEMYYRQWADLENGILAEGDYIDLFLTSDAIIHDSGSFTIEYLSTSKPCLYTIHDEGGSDRLNDFGRLAFNLHYHAYEDNDILKFIDKVVLGGNDIKREERIGFINQYLLPPNQKTASENIVSDLIQNIIKI